MSEKGFWRKIKAGMAVLLAGITIAIPTIKYAKDRNTKTLNEGEKITEKDTNVNKDDGFIENEDGSLTPNRQSFIDSIKVEKNDESSYVGLSYYDLLNRLDDVVSKKGFSDIEYKHIKGLLDDLYNNYDERRAVNKDWPSKEKFICENVIDPLKVCTLHFVEQNSEEGKELDEEGAAHGFTSSDYKITIVYNENENERDFEYVNEMLLHELAHITQSRFVFNGEYFNKYPYLKQIIIEGGATSKMKAKNVLKTERMASGYIPLGEDIMLSYEADNGQGYAKYGNLYNNLEYLVGYDVMESLKSGESLDIIERTISNNYGQANSKKIMEFLKKMYEADSQENYDIEFNSAVELQNVFFDCIEQDISKLNGKQEIEEFVNIYRWYMINSPKVYKDMYTDISSEYFGKKKELDEIMVQKIIKSGAFGIKSENAAASLIYTDTNNIIERPTDYYWIFVASNLETTVFKENKDGSLTVSYLNRSVSGDEEICINMDTNGVDNQPNIEILDEIPNDLIPFYGENQIER